MDKATKASVQPIVRANIARETRLMAEESGVYAGMSRAFAEHLSVGHSIDEYGRGDAHTNTVESFSSIFERGFKGIYQHCGEQHLHRYLAECDFRYNNRAAFGIDDLARMNAALEGAKGERLT